MIIIRGTLIFVDRSIHKLRSFDKNLFCLFDFCVTLFAFLFYFFLQKKKRQSRSTKKQHENVLNHTILCPWNYVKPQYFTVNSLNIVGMEFRGFVTKTIFVGF
jgi:hypothetical protein